MLALNYTMLSQMLEKAPLNVAPAGFVAGIKPDLGRKAGFGTQNP
jgi:hypothetical protein